MLDLKPCPHCGAEPTKTATVAYVTDDGENAVLYEITCAKCSVGASSLIMVTDERPDEEIEKEMDATADKWNRRVSVWWDGGKHE